MNVINNYQSDHNGWISVKSDSVNKNNQIQVTKETAKMAVIELVKAAGNAGMLGLVGLATAVIAFVVFKIAAVIIGILAFPTAIIPPIYSALTTLGGLTAGGIVGYLIAKKYGNDFFKDMKEHFNYSMHLFSEAKRVYKLSV